MGMLEVSDSAQVALPLPGSKNPFDGQKASADSIVMYDKLQ